MFCTHSNVQINFVIMYLFSQSSVKMGNGDDNSFEKRRDDSESENEV